jgi:sugar-specific transcriptional regulator TrmB
MAYLQLNSYLKSLDFGENEVKTYSKLLELGQSTAGPIIAKTGLHRNIVYTALEHLTLRKLVSEAQVKGKKFYSINSPTILEQEFKEKAEAAKAFAGSVQELLKAPIQEITIHQGNDEYLSLLSGLIKNLPKGSTKYVLGTGGEAFMENTMRPIWKKYHKVAHEQEIKIKMLGYESQRQAIDPDIKPEGMYEVKYLPNNIENPSGLHVYPEIDTVLNIIYSDNTKPVTAIKIKDKSLVQGYLNLFNNLWSQAQ